MCLPNFYLSQHIFYLSQHICWADRAESRTEFGQTAIPQRTLNVSDKKTDWNKAFKELAVYKPKYGVIVHGVPTAHVTGIKDADIQKSTIQEWEEKNGIKIHSIKQLRRKPRSNKNAEEWAIP